MEVGKAELSRASANYLAGLVFAVAFLIAELAGTSLLTAIFRAGVAAIVVRLVTPLLLNPMWSVILEAMARDRAAQPEEEQE